MLIATFPLAPLLAIEATGARNVERLAALAVKLAAALSLAALAASPAVAVARAWISRDQNDVEPRQELAIAATLFWREATGRPLAYVGGARFYDNGVVFYSADRPHGFVGFDEFRNQWVTPERLAEGGLLSVCVKDDAACLAAAAPFRSCGQPERRDHARARGLRPYGEAGRVRRHGDPAALATRRRPPSL